MPIISLDDGHCLAKETQGGENYETLLLTSSENWTKATQIPL